MDILLLENEEYTSSKHIESSRRETKMRDAKMRAPLSVDRQGTNMGQGWSFDSVSSGYILQTVPADGKPEPDAIIPCRMLDDAHE